jgi:hypothetical protein
MGATRATAVLVSTRRDRENPLQGQTVVMLYGAHGPRLGMAEIQTKLEETRRQMEATKALISEKKPPG